jgi:type IV pilus assembly protein PilC
MPTFEYQQRDHNGNLQKGQVDAADIREAAAKIRSEGSFIIALKPVAESKNLTEQKKAAGGRVKLRDLVLFTRQFAVVMKAGLNIITSLNLLAKQTESAQLSLVATQVRQEVESGHPLHTALAKYPKIFPPIYIHMVEAGEAGGMLDTVLERLAENFERSYELHKKIIGSLMYPIILSTVAIGVVIFLMVAVLPTFLKMFTDSGMKLPGMTVVLMSVSLFLGRWWFILLPALGAAAFAFIQYRQTPAGRYATDNLILNIKFVGPAVRKIVVAQFARTMATLLNSGILITSSMEIVERVVTNAVIARALTTARINLTQGGGLAGPLNDTGVFPPMVTQMVAVGEETGELPGMLTELADFYEKEAGYAMESLTALIEPAIIVVMGIVVGFIVISVAIPMLDISSGATLK